MEFLKISIVMLKAGLKSIEIRITHQLLESLTKTVIDGTCQTGSDVRRLNGVVSRERGGVLIGPVQWLSGIALSLYRLIQLGWNRRRRRYVVGIRLIGSSITADSWIRRLVRLRSRIWLWHRNGSNWIRCIDRICLRVRWPIGR